MSARDRRSLAWWSAFAVLCGAATARSLTARAPAPAAAASDPVLRAAYAELAEAEPEMRAESERDFPAELWSQDDAFHNLEYLRAMKVANGKHVRVGDVLRAYDDGIRHKWDGYVSAKPGIVPCRPRPIY